MATIRYAGKYCCSPHPQATRIKTFNFLWYLSLGEGRFGIPPGQIFFLCWGGRLFLLGGHVLPSLPTTRTDVQIDCGYCDIAHELRDLSSLEILMKT